MEDKLFLNTKLFGGMDGIIGRRDYFLNTVIIASIALIFTLPYTICLLSNSNFAELMFDIQKSFQSSPILIKIWLIIGLIITVILGVSNIFRRLNDIQGSNKKEWGIIFSTIYACANFGFLF